ATSPLKPVPFWRSIPLAGVGALVLLFTGLFIGSVSGHHLRAGVYLEFIAGFCLLLMAALEVRGQGLHYLREQRIRATEPPRRALGQRATPPPGPGAPGGNPRSGAAAEWICRPCHFR